MVEADEVMNSGFLFIIQKFVNIFARLLLSSFCVLVRCYSTLPILVSSYRIIFVLNILLYTFFEYLERDALKLNFLKNIGFLKFTILLYIIMVSVSLNFVSLSRDCSKSQS
jgi:hypothetical protein